MDTSTLETLRLEPYEIGARVPYFPTTDVY